MAGDGDGARPGEPGSKGGRDGTGGARPAPLSADERAELAALRARFPPRHRLRSAVSAVLITLAALLAPLSVVAVWAADQMTNTDRYVRTIEPLASQPEVQAAVTDNVTDAVMARVDIDTLLSGVAPKDRPKLKLALGALGGPITGGIRDFVHQTVAAFVASDTFRSLWVQLNRQAHAAFVGALTGDSDTAVRVSGDTVTLDLAPVVEQVKQQLVDRGLTVASGIPRVHTKFTLVESKDVRRVRTGFRALRAAGNWLPAITVLMAAGGVLLAARRRRALVTAALAVAIGVTVLGIGLSVFRIVYLDHLPANISEPAAGAVYDQIVRFLRVTVRMTIALGIVVALGAWLSGSGRWASRVRSVWAAGIGAAREAAGITSTGPVGPWVRHYRHALNWLVVLVAAVVLLLWSYPTGMVIFWIALVTVVALAVVEFLDDGRQRHGARVSAP